MRQGVKAAARRRRQRGVTNGPTTGATVPQRGVGTPLRPMAIGALIFCAANSFGLLGTGLAHAQDHFVQSLFGPILGGIGHFFSHVFSQHR